MWEQISLLYIITLADRLAYATQDSKAFSYLHNLSFKEVDKNS